MQAKYPNPFIVFCQKTIPLAFDESMSFMEALYALKAYLENEIVPTVNANGQAVQDMADYLANLDLHSYVDQIMKEYIDAGTFYETLNYDNTTQTLTLTFDMARS